jgi:2-polyprenyl-3-methyl-5-hydroxy-6-metoxy-1,4-benzoquinol methylase
MTVTRAEADEAVAAALASWRMPSHTKAREVEALLHREFPDDVPPVSFRTAASSNRFREFFVWGHDHDFGHGVTRRGAMGMRHCEIAAEALREAFLPPRLDGLSVLDVGCWSGGDALVLAGMGAAVTATEEHPRSAASARRLLELVGCPAAVHETSLYRDDPAWRQAFDIVYCGGVVYHVTDPLLLLRICFCYLRPGGRLIVETKADLESRGSVCQYSGTQVAGWNYFAPSETALARWLEDAGFDKADIRIATRPVGRFLACAMKRDAAPLPETAGFSRPGSWLEGVN